MGSGIKFGLGIVMCVLAVITQAALAADMPAKGGDDHAAANQTKTGAPEVASYDKLDIKLTPVSEWDPNMQLQPFNSKNGVRVFLAYMRAQIEKTKTDPKIKAEEKDKLIKFYEEVMKSAIVTFNSVSDYSAVSSAFYICPVGLELPITNVLPESLRRVALTASGAPLCIILGFSKNAGTGGTDGFMMGLGAWAGAQATYNLQGDAGKRRTGNPELQVSGGILVPLNGDAPVLRLGDVQGYYLGGGIEAAVPTFNKNLTGFISGSVSGYYKIDGLKKPDVAMVQAVVGRTSTAPFPIKGEALYFGTYVGTDGTEFRVPTVPFSEMSLPFTGGSSASSKHSVKERQKEVSSKEVLQMIDQAKPFLDKYK